MCYSVPLIGAVTVSVVWKRNQDVKTWWLSLMFYGGALFGVIDHLWNGELFLVSENIVSDLLLGVTITVFLFLSWGAMLLWSKVNPTLANYMNIGAGTE